MNKDGAHYIFDSRHAIIQTQHALTRLCLETLETVLRRNRLRWFGHVERREKGNVLRSSEGVNVCGAKPRGRPKNTWMKTIEDDLKKTGLKKSICQDREIWRQIIHRQ